jgi:hypothetical protein
LSEAEFGVKCSQGEVGRIRIDLADHLIVAGPSGLEEVEVVRAAVIAVT